jgi:hypothetical protein
MATSYTNRMKRLLTDAGIDYLRVRVRRYGDSFSVDVIDDEYKLTDIIAVRDLLGVVPTVDAEGDCTVRIHADGVPVSLLGGKADTGCAHPFKITRSKIVLRRRDGYYLGSVQHMGHEWAAMNGAKVKMCGSMVDAAQHLYDAHLAYEAELARIGF